MKNFKDKVGGPKSAPKELGILVLVKGRDGSGRAQYAYVSVPPEKYADFKEAEEKGNYNLAAFGEILLHAFGEAPDATIMQEMEQKYGANHRFEEDLQKLFETSET